MHHSHHWHRHGWHRHGWQRGVGFLALIVVAVVAFGWIVMQLWNAVLPDVFGWKTISYFQALGLLVLSKIFFGGWHRGGHHHGCHHRRHDGWANLSDEEREKLRSKFRHRWCGMHDHDEHDARSDAKPGSEAV